MDNPECGGIHERDRQPIGGGRESLWWFDRIVTAGIGLLIIGTPLAIGSVHRWAYATTEVMIFAWRSSGCCAYGWKDRHPRA